LSGSWVVREGKLCGVVYAAYDRSPYLHMLPAEEMFQNIAEFLQASVVRVANAQDIEGTQEPLEVQYSHTSVGVKRLGSMPSRQEKYSEQEELFLSGPGGPETTIVRQKPEPNVRQLWPTAESVLDSQNKYREGSVYFPGRIRRAGINTMYSGNQARSDSTGVVHLSGRPSGPGESASNRCLRDLRVTDPREDRARIESDKERLLRDCYAWILDDASFQRWRTQDESRLLWIKGDPGTGKTMMMMGVIDELSRGDGVNPTPWAISKVLSKLRFGSEPRVLAYFFCQSTRAELNNAVSVLRGLIYLLVAQQDQLLRHVQKRYETVGSKLFEGPNAIHALREILSDILNDPTLPMTYILVDALDECTSSRSALLSIITDVGLAKRSRVKWLVTSRNLSDIEHYLHPDLAGINVSLEVSAARVSAAVEAFVNFKVQDLANVKKYEAGLRAAVQQLLQSKAEGTFLWVSLVCKEMERVPLFRTREVLQAMPIGLDPLYDRMMAQILAQDHIKTRESCKDVLRAVTVSFRPLRLKELVVVAGLPSDQFYHPQAVADLLGYCGSFLTIRQDTVSFIHLSAKDYLTSGNGQQIFDGAVAEVQRHVTYRLINAMRDTLHRDLCGLEKQGPQMKGMTERIQGSVLPQIVYACEYWVDHLCASDLTSSATSEDILEDGGVVHLFLQEKFLNWLEALSLCKSVSRGIVTIEKLWSLTTVSCVIITVQDCELIEAREENIRAH
jgi:hypothetical protein